jgi:hypothetical protein
MSACSWTSASLLTCPEWIGRDHIVSSHMFKYSSVKMEQTLGTLIGAVGAEAIFE